MILMGAGHQPLVPLRPRSTGRCSCSRRSPGARGVNGGGWAHYVGQEKASPITGWAQLAFGLDWSRPPRQMVQTGYWYLHTDQWRYDTFAADALAGAAAGNGALRRA